MGWWEPLPSARARPALPKCTRIEKLHTITSCFARALPDALTLTQPPLDSSESSKEGRRVPTASRFPLSPFRPDVAFRRALTFQGFSAFHSKSTQSLQCAAMCRCASQELVVQALAREAQLFLGAELQSDRRNSGARRAQWLSIKPPEHQFQDGDPAEETSAPDRGHPNDKHHTQSLNAALVSLCSFLHRCTP